MSEGTFFPITDASFGSELSPEAFDMLAGQYLASLGPNEGIVRPEWTQSKEVRRRKFLAALVAGVQAGLAGGSGGAAQIFAGEPNPNGYQTATGPAVYLQSDTSPPTEWFKVTPGTSNNEWVSASGSGGFVSIYSGAATTPQAAGWTVLDGRVTQPGLDVRATTGTTAITTGSGLTLDGSFNLSPIGSTLATFSSTSCTFGDFSPGTLSNLSTLSFTGCTFDSIDITGCQNQLVFNMTGCGCPTVTTQNTPGLYNVFFFTGSYGNLNFSGCPELNSVTVTGAWGPSAGNLTCGTVTITNSTTLTAVVLVSALFPGDSFGAVSITGCTALGSVNLTGANLPSVDLTGCTNLTVLYLDATGNYSLNLTNCTALTTFDIGTARTDIVSLNISGCSSLAGVETTLGYSTLQTVTLTTLPAMSYCRFPGAALNAASVNAILVALDANGLLNGTLDLSGGTSAAPTGAGITAKNSLVSKGWLVMTN